LKLTCLGRGSSDFYEIWHTDALITTCPGIDIALEGGFDQAGKAGFGVLHASQLVGHAARLLYCMKLSFCAKTNVTLMMKHRRQQRHIRSTTA